MEKKIGSREVMMQPAKGDAQAQKLSYEELNQACMDMSQQVQQQDKYIRQLRQQVQQMGYALQERRLDYLFRVVEIASKNTVSEYACFAKDFVEECIAEIQEAMTLPEKEEGDAETPKEE